MVIQTNFDENAPLWQWQQLSDINNHPFIVPPSDAVFSFRSFSREHDLATVKVGGKEAGLASCWLAICPAALADGLASS